MTLFVIVSEIRGGVFIKFTRKRKRTAAKTKAARLLTYVGRPNNGTLSLCPQTITILTPKQLDE